VLGDPYRAGAHPERRTRLLGAHAGDDAQQEQVAVRRGQAVEQGAGRTSALLGEQRVLGSGRGVGAVREPVGRGAAVAVEGALRVADLVHGDAVDERGEGRAGVDVARERLDHRHAHLLSHVVRRPVGAVGAPEPAAAVPHDPGAQVAEELLDGPGLPRAGGGTRVASSSTTWESCAAVPPLQRSGDQAAAEAQRDGLRAVVDAELAEQPARRAS
jgi:hypothetical protein